MIALTAKQYTMLTHIGRIAECGEFDGYSPEGARQWRTIRALNRAGLVKWDGPAECGDGCERAGDCPHPVQLYNLTDKGHRRLDDENGGAK